MELKDKLEILIKRNGYKKTDFASAVSLSLIHISEPTRP